MMSATEVASALPPRDLANDTCCPEEAELIPCSACYEKHHRESSGKPTPEQSLLLSPVPEPLPISAEASASLQRVPPPELPHGHAASAPEDIRHHQAHARQLPAPNPPDPQSPSEEEGAGRAKQLQGQAVETGPRGRERTQGMEVRAAADPPALSFTSSPAASSLPVTGAMGGGVEASYASALPYTAAQSSHASFYPLASAAVGAPNAGDRTQSGYLLANHIDQPHPSPYYPTASQPLYAAHPAPSQHYYDPAQHADLYSMYTQQVNHMAQAQQPSHLPSPYSLMSHPAPVYSSNAAPVYASNPVTMAAPNGTLVYFPNPTSSHHLQQPQAPPSLPQPHMGYLSHYYQPQPSLPAQQSAHHSHAAQSHGVSMQQPITFINGVPMYLSPAPPSEAESSYAPHYPHPPTASHHAVRAGQRPSISTASIASTVSSTPSSPSGRVSDNERSPSTYKTEICRSHQYSGCCEYGPSCQFAHGLEELRTREVDVKFKTERCKNFHQFGPSSCWYGPRCKFIHDEFRVRVGAYEFWLISPRENMVRVEKVEAGNAPRLSQLAQLIGEQAGPAQQAAQSFVQQMDLAADSLCDQLQQSSLQDHDAAPKADAAARFLKALVSPHHGGLTSSTPTPINVQAMQVQPSHHHRGPKALGFGGPLAQYGAGANGPSAISSFLSPSGPPHQQLGGQHHGGVPSSLPPAGYQHPPPRLPSPFPRRGGQQQPAPTVYNPSTLSVLSNFLTPQALQLLSLNGCNAIPGVGRVGEEPKRRKRIRKKKRTQPRTAFSRAEDDSTSSEVPEADREDRPHTGEPSSEDEDDTEIDQDAVAHSLAAPGQGSTHTGQTS